MNIHQLRCAVMVARMGSQTRAAEALYMSQPNLSKALKDLEQTCGFRIFNRTGAGMLPTRKGEEFLLRARSVLEQMDAMDAIYQGHNRTTAYLSVAVPRASYISHAVTEFVNSLDPRCAMELNVRETNTNEVIRDVLAARWISVLCATAWKARISCWAALRNRDFTIFCTGRSGTW